MSASRTKRARISATCSHGKLDKSKLGFGERAVMLAFRVVEGDYRDWNEIEAWATGIAHELGP